MLCGIHSRAVLTQQGCPLAVLRCDYNERVDTQRIRNKGSLEHNTPLRALNRSRPCCRKQAFARLVTANANLTRRDVISTASGVLLSGSCWPALALDDSQNFVSKGSEDLAANLTARVKEFTLSNGLHFIVLERHIAPIVSCHTYADVGAFDEVDGQTGIAHLLEHMAFKGSPRIGTKDYAKEAPLLEAMDEVFYSKQEAEASGRMAAAEQLEGRLQQLEQQAAAFSTPNEFGSILSQAGAVGLNATTSHDATRYFMAMPNNKLELWFALEAERFRAPVFRELYSEKQVVLEERRMRVDDSPMGRFQEGFAGEALTNNYRRPVIGYPADLALLGRHEVQGFFNKHYGPQRLCISVVGDVQVEQVQKLAEKYFGGWKSMSNLPAGPSPVVDEPLPRPEGSRHFEQASKAGPLLMQAYYRPSMTSSKAVVMEIICEHQQDVEHVSKKTANVVKPYKVVKPSNAEHSASSSDLLSSSRTSRFYNKLVETGKAYSANAVASYPGEKHPNALVLFGQPGNGVSLQQLEAAIKAELEGLVHSGPNPKEMARIKKAAKLTLVDGIRSNTNMASALCSYHVNAGSWSKLLTDLEQVDTLTANDIQSTAASVFAEDNCYTGYMLKA